MTDCTKNVVDVVITLLAMIGTVIAFIHTLRQWSASQRWRRMEKLDQLIEYFERDPLLRVARTSVDWTARKIKHDGRYLTITNTDALLALRDHRHLLEGGEFEGEQATIRDGYDALLSFLARLEVALTGGLIDRDPAGVYFSYWLERFLTMDRHKDKDGSILEGKSPSQMAREYISMYGDMKSVERLCVQLGLALSGQ